MFQIIMTAPGCSQSSYGDCLSEARPFKHIQTCYFPLYPFLLGFMCLLLILCVTFFSLFSKWNESKCLMSDWAGKKNKPLASCHFLSATFDVDCFSIPFLLWKTATEQCKSYDLYRQMAHFSRTFLFLWFNKKMLSTCPVKQDGGSLILVLLLA